MLKELYVPIRVSILTIFVSLLVSTILIITLITFFRSADSLITVSDKLMKKTSSLVSKELDNHLNPVSNASRLTAELIENKTLRYKDDEQLEQYFRHLLKTLPQAAMAYWGDEKGNFVIARKRAKGIVQTEIIDRSVTPAIRIYKSYDSQGNFLDQQKSTKMDYDPRVRSWYIVAKQQKTNAWSDAYLFYSGRNKVIGITSATPVYGDGKLIGVIGVDIKLNEISQFLTNITIGKQGLTFILNDKSDLIAFPGLTKKFAEEEREKSLSKLKEFAPPWVVAAFDKYKMTRSNKFFYHFKGQKYSASFQEIPSFAQYNWLVSVVVPEDDFIGDLKESNAFTTILSIAVLLIGVMIVHYFSKKITKPFVKLAQETERIRLFHLEDSEPIQSYIKEVKTMESALNSMKVGLRSFKKYVPADLVRQLVSQHQAAKIGGDKKEITVMFTDIANFTSISETMAPEKLMNYLCEYFDTMVATIREKGILDKYIGDGVMAIWGAPLDDAEHCMHACQAALNCRAQLASANKKWQQQGKPPLVTRIGIHTGKAIVGNLGSSERLNYTAVGDVVNLGSRLESLNKIYHSKIIVSQEVQEKVEDYFYFRLLDLVTVKGKTESTRIYELVAERTKKLNAKLINHHNKLAQAFAFYQQQDWQKAINLYREILQQYPDNDLPELFIKRCRYFQSHPPPKDWDGVWRFETK